MSTPPPDQEARLQELLRGFPEPTVRALSEFRQTGDKAAFDRAFAGVIEHHLQARPAVPVAELPGTTTLVGDLGLDSLTLAEMAFLFEDLFATSLPHEDYVRVNTLDDLRTLLLGRIQPRPST